MIEASADYREKIYANIRKIVARVLFTMDGVTKTYEGDSIISISILEEMDSLSSTLPADELKVVMDNSHGDFAFLSLVNTETVLAKKPVIRVELGLELGDGVEWVQMGAYYLVEWKSSTGSRTVSMVARDSFEMMSDTSYLGSKPNLYELAVDVLRVARVTSYRIDEGLRDIVTEGFSKRLDCRSALQKIGVASRSAVYQNRDNVLVIKPFKKLDESNNFLTYAGVSFYPGASVFMRVDNGFDMKNINFDNIFTEPEISLEKSINELVVKIRDGVEYVFKDEVVGKNGRSYTVENELVVSQVQAKEIADWLMAENKNSIVYKTNWRQNMILECGDVIMVEDSFGAKKQTRIIKQEFSFKGYLNGYTESRGGL